MSEEKSKFRQSRLLWILGWTGAWMVICLSFWFLLFRELLFSILGEHPEGFLGVQSPVLLFFEIAGSVLLFRSADPKLTLVRVICSTLCAIFGLEILTIYYVAVPGYVIPFLNNPNTRMILFAFMLWQAIGFFVLARVQKLWDWLGAVICFSLPLALLMRLGPIVLFRNTLPDDMKFEAVMSRQDFGGLFRFDVSFIVAFIILACASYPGIWIKLFRLDRKTDVASAA